MEPAPAQPSPPRRSGRRLLGTALFTLFFGGGWVAIHWANTTLAAIERPASMHKAYRVISVPEGVALGRVATILHDHGLVHDRRLFARYARWRGAAPQLKYGEYRLSTDMNMREVLERLVAGNVLTHRFTVREGVTVKHIARDLEKLGLAEADDILRLAEDPGFLGRFGITAPNAEGYLFPETYHVAKGLGAEQLMEIMLREFQIQTTDLADEIAASGHAPYDILKMASIIEKEALLETELPLVSAVLYNRIAKNMLLQCDVTIRYPLDNYGQHLTYEDLELDSPYNSYKYKGLPPTPICNPGRAALEAALRPADVPYLYFVSMNSGAHFFSNSYKEHQAAVKKYQVQKERGPRRFPDGVGVEQRPRPAAPPEPATEVLSTSEAFPDLEAAPDEVQMAGLQDAED